MPAEVPEGMHLLHVSNTLETLQIWAAEARSSWSHPVVALVGSNGKTVVKEWAAELLATSLRVVRSPRSYNSQVGVPLSLLTLSPEADAALVEMGISESGEMTGLVRMVRPTGVVFTSFGSAHALGFASEEAKLAEKMQAVEGTPAPRLCLLRRRSLGLDPTTGTVSRCCCSRSTAERFGRHGVIPSRKKQGIAGVFAF
jgi:UDP-N-acetylmuramyl pentapeptide synthase